MKKKSTNLEDHINTLSPKVLMKLDYEYILKILTSCKGLYEQQQLINERKEKT